MNNKIEERLLFIEKFLERKYGKTFFEFREDWFDADNNGTRRHNKFDVPDEEPIKRNPIRFGYDENGKFTRIKDENR